MLAMILTAFGGPDQLRPAEVDRPEPGPGQIGVRVHSIGVNPMDAKIRSGAAFFPVSLPTVLGREFAGTVAALGAGVAKVALGDRVVGLATSGFGTYAEYTVSDCWVKLSHRVAFETAAAVPIAAGTAARVLDELAIRAGQTLLIGGARGAVGAMAVQLAVARGLNVIGTGGVQSQDSIRSLGAEPVLYGPGLADRVRALTDHVDAAFDTAGKGDLQALIELCGPEHVITIADEQARSLGVRFSTGVGFAHDVDHIRAAIRRLEEGQLIVRIGHRLPLRRAADAHRISEDGHPDGKIILFT